MVTRFQVRTAHDEDTYRNLETVYYKLFVKPKIKWNRIIVGIGFLTLCLTFVFARGDMNWATTMASREVIIIIAILMVHMSV